MGSCVSVHKGQESVMKLRFSIGSKNEKILIPSPVKEKVNDTVNVGDRTVANGSIKSHCFRDAGSKDEAFFDSQPWLESDCEDDYFSVNGDFTPSRGNTPIHHSFTLGNLLVNKEGPLSSSVPQPSPPDKKKRLSELFKESLRGDEEYADEDPAKANCVVQRTKPSNGTPYLSGPNSRRSHELTPNGVLRAEDKSLKSPQCCLPKLLSGRGFRERERKMSLAPNVG